MEYRLLGSSGCAVSALALGTLTFGNETDQATSFSQLDRFAEAGGTLVDSADVYADGRAEEIIGRWLAARPGRRELVVLATKGRFPTDESPNGHGLSRRHLSLALDASLRRLNVETIDLYQLHAWDPLTRLEETLRFLDDAVRAGKINYVGLSNFTGWQLQKAVDIAEFRGLSVPVSMQPQYNLLARAVEWEIAPACQAAGLGMLAWSPLASGWLTGKYRRGDRPGRHPGGGERRRGDADLEPARPVRADLAGARRGAQGGRGPRGVPGSGSHRLADGPARRIVGDPRRPEHGPADGQHGRGRAEADA